LEELGYRFYKAKKIDTLMVYGAALNLECSLFKEFPWARTAESFLAGQ
jgi:hypothetical protein